MEKIYNLDKVVSINIYDKSLYYYLEYHKPRKPWFSNKPYDATKGRFRHAFNIGSPKYYTAEDLMNGEYNDVKYLVINNKVYEKPYVKITFVNNDKIVIKFETYEEALDWGRGQANIAIHLDKQLITE